MRIGIFGKGRLAQAIFDRAGDRVSWLVSREQPPLADIDVAIEASSGAVVQQRLNWAIEHRIPLVIGSTGWQLPDLKAQVGEKIGVVVAPNFSLTVALMTRIARIMARFCELESGRDPYIFEHHHARKKDAPSGTARLLAETMLAELSRKQGWSIPALGQAFAEDQLCVSSMRAGVTYSSHIVGIDSPDEVLELHHSARNPGAFASGALLACDFIRSRRGVFPFSAVAASQLDSIFQEVTHE